MNVLELLYQELKDKDWTFEEKARYIFIRSCELFSYDPRYQFCGLLGLRGQALSRSIRARKIDLENVNDTGVVCTSHTKYVISILLKELLGAEVFIEGDGHIYTTFKNGHSLIMADSTKTSDIARVKMGLSTKRYCPKKKAGITEFYERLKQIDMKINYIPDDYQEVILREQINKMMREKKWEDNYFVYGMHIVEKLFEKYRNLPGFCDASFCLNYLSKLVLREDFYDRLEKFPLFCISSDGIWNFVKIYTLDLSTDVIYYILKQQEDGFSFKKITQEEALKYSGQYDGMNRSRIIRK